MNILVSKLFTKTNELIGGKSDDSLCGSNKIKLDYEVVSSSSTKSVDHCNF